MHTAAAAVSAAALYALPVHAQSSAPQLSPIATVAAAAQKAVVLLRVYDEAGSLTALGSGFIALDGRVVTNRHVVAGAARVEVVDWRGRLLLTTPYAEALSTEADLAILPAISDAPASLSLSRTVPVVGEPVVAIGAPEGLMNTVTAGIVSAYRDLPSRKMLQISAPLSHGSSGGPVLNLEGAVIGVSASILPEGQNLNFAVPAAAIRAVLSGPAKRIELRRRAGTATAGSATRSAEERRWVKVAQNKRKVVSLDKRSVVRLAEKVYSASFEWKFSAPQIAPNSRVYTRVRTHEVINCQRFQYAQQKVLHFDAPGNAVFSRDHAGAGEPRFEDVVPGSLGEAKVLNSCRSLEGLP